MILEDLSINERGVKCWSAMQDRVVENISVSITDDGAMFGKDALM
jgi:hypothetical protein